MMDYFTIEKNAVTGQITKRYWTPEQIAAHEAAPKQVPESITRRQCALQLLEMKIISAEEALVMTKAGDMPLAVYIILEKELSDPEAFIRAQIDFAAANYYRSNSLLGMMGMSPEQIDQFFIAAASR
jgi:hypothetical protein